MSSLYTVPAGGFNYLPRPLAVQSQATATGMLHYVLAADGYALPLYFALKGKHAYQMLGREQFLRQVRDAIAETLSGYDVVVIPESRSLLVQSLVQEAPAEVVLLRKRSKVELCDLVASLTRWSRDELASQRRAWAVMGERFVMSEIKSNQRQHYRPHLFEPLGGLEGKRIILLDDFIMSGSTVHAMRLAVGRDTADMLSLFYQPSFKRGQEAS